MKVLRPEVLQFESPDGQFQLRLPRPSRRPVLQWADRTYAWGELRDDCPQTVLFNAALGQVIFLGGLGDPGASLGAVRVYAVDGRLLRDLRLGDYIDDLAALAGAYRTRLANFPWLSASRFGGAGTTLHLWVVEKIAVTIDLHDLTVTTMLDANPDPWRDAIRYQP